MSEKSPLEIEIERHEMYKTPISVTILVIILLISLCVVSIYAFKLKEELSKREQEIVLMKDNFQREKIELLRKIKKFEREPDYSVSDSN